MDLPCETSSPNEGDPGGKPNPRKSRAVSVVMEPVRIKGMNVMVATMALGKICLNMMLVSSRPSAFAAFTYSRLRPLRNSARTTGTRVIQLNSSMIPNSHQKFGLTMLESMISRKSVGSEETAGGT